MLGVWTTRKLIASLLLVALALPRHAAAAEKDTHYWLTMKIGLVCGFSLKEARLIATGDWGLDENEEVISEFLKPPVQEFIINNWPNPPGLAEANKPTLRTRTFCFVKNAKGDSCAFRDQVANAKKSAGKYNGFGAYLGPYYNTLMTELGVTPQDVTNIFLKSSQFRFHAFPTEQVAGRVQQMKDQQQVFADEFHAQGLSASVRMLKFGRFIHYAQDKWFHWPYITGSGHGGPSVDGACPDSAQVTDRAHYRRMVTDTAMWMGELWLALNRQNPKCGDGQPGALLGGPWNPKEFDDDAEVKQTKGQVAGLKPLLDKIVKASDEAWWYAFIDKEAQPELPKERVAKIKYRNTLLPELGILIAKDIDNKKTAAQLDYPKGLKYAPAGDMIVPNNFDDDPEKALDQLVTVGAALPRVRALKGHGLQVVSMGTKTLISGTVDLQNFGTTPSDPGDMSVELMDYADLENILDVVTVPVPAIAPGATTQVSYSSLVDGDLEGRLVSAFGMVDVGETLGDNDFTDLYIQLAGKDTSITASPAPIVPYPLLARSVIGPWAVERSDGNVTFRVRFPKLAGPPATIANSVLTLSIGDNSLDVPQSTSVNVDPGFQRTVELTFGPANLVPSFSGFPPDQLPETIAAGLVLHGQAGAEPFDFIHGPILIDVERITSSQTIPGTKLLLTTGADPSNDKFSFMSKSPTGTMPSASDAPTEAGAHLRVFGLGGSGGDASWRLARHQWRALRGQPPKGYQYQGAGTVDDPCKRVVVKQARTGIQLRVSCRLAGLDLHPPFAGAVGVFLDVGGARYCAQFPALTGATPGRQLGKNAPAPGVCPKSPSSSPSGAFLDPLDEQPAP